MDMSQSPDVIAMLKIEAQVSTFGNKSASKVLPVVREKLHSLARVISNANNVIRARVVVGVVVINNQFSDAQTQAELKPYELEEEYARLRKKLGAGLKDVEAAIKEVSDLRAPDITERQADLQNDREKHRLAIARISGSKAEQELKLLELNETMAVLERPSLRKVFKSLIPSNEDIDAIISTLKLTTLEIEQVKVVVEKVNKNLEWLEEGRRFADLVLVRSKLRDRIGELQASVSLATTLLEKTDEEISQYLRVAEMNGLKEQWLEEAGKFQKNWQSRQSSMAELSQAPALNLAFKDLLNYLVDVRLQFEAH